MKSGFALAILAATLVAGRTHNDWSKPCFEGECAYDIPDHKQQSGAVKLFSKPHAIADITPAAGWVVLDCDPHALSQDIRLVCKGDDAEGSGCAHLFGGAGPVDKHVRLPESCSSLPFARISKFWVHEDQSVSEHHGVTRRDNSVPQVYAVNIDDKFDQVDYSKHGDVHFVMYGASVPGVDINSAIPEDVSNMDAVGEFIQKAVSELQDSIKTQRNHHLQARTTTPGGWKFTSIKASVSPFYPDGQPENIHVSSPDIQLKALPKSATQGKLIALPKGEGFKSEISAPKGWGSASTAFSSIEVKGHAMSCPIEALGSKAKGVETKAELDITGTIDTFMWGQGQWGGCGYGKNNVFSKLLGFLEDFTLNIRHENNINVALKGSTTWSKEFGPVSVPQVTAIHLGVAQLGLLGALKLEAKLTAEASLQLTNKLQYGFNHATITMPSKEKGGLRPYFNATEIGAKFAGGANSKVSLEIGVTPKVMVGAMTTGGGAKADSWFGVEVKLTAEAQASKTIFESAAAPGPPSSTELGYVVKIGVDPHVGVEAKIDWTWLKSWTGWTPGMEVKHSLWKKEWPPLACGGSLCPSKKRSVGDHGEVAMRSIDYTPFNSDLSKRAGNKISVPAKSTSFTCPPKEWGGKVKEFVGAIVDMSKLAKGLGAGM